MLVSTVPCCLVLQLLALLYSGLNYYYSQHLLTMSERRQKKVVKINIKFKVVVYRV